RHHYPIDERSNSNESTPSRDEPDPVYLALKQATGKYSSPRGSHNFDSATPSPRNLSQASLQDSGYAETSGSRSQLLGSTPQLDQSGQQQNGYATGRPRAPKLHKQMKSLSLDCADAPPPMPPNGAMRSPFKTKPLRQARGYANSGDMTDLGRSVSPTSSPRRLPLAPRMPGTHIVTHEYIQSQELALYLGDRLHIVDNGDPDWLHGFKVNDRTEQLLTFPTTCVAAFQPGEQPMKLTQNVLTQTVNETKLRLYRDQIIRDFLRREPQTLDDYANFFEVATFLRWNSSEDEAKQNLLRDCVLSNVEPQSNVYRVAFAVDSHETRDVNPGASVRLSPKDDAQAIVVAVDRCAGFVDISPESSAKVSTATTYDISILPSAFLFKSHLRAIRLLLEKQLNSQIYPSLPTKAVANQHNVDAAVGNAMKDTMNAMQRHAVMEILSGRHGGTPYLLFGPPGTGKTTTVVEAVRLLLRASPTNRILLCAPSNVAADLLAVELLRHHAIDWFRMRRLYSIYRPLSEMHPFLKDVVTVVDGSSGKSFGFEAREMLLQYRVLVCTLAASTYLVDGGLDGSFSHIIIDEAGQATEVDCLIPIAGLANERTRVVLAGDPKQLGPVIKEDFLKGTFYGNSMLARLMERSCYASDTRFMCQLVENYRSHECILRVPSDAFYGGTLVPKAPDDRYSLCHWARLPKKNFPLMWIDVRGIEELAGQDGCSYCNEDEITALLNVVLNLLEETDVEPKDIGIITPYKLQVRKLREVLKRIPQITVDSVERYQGSERRVIIISTVRTDGLGFLACDKVSNPEFPLR
ncbi:helicase mov-10-B.2-like protein, partial [Aphelenchoides avenae]